MRAFSWKSVSIYLTIILFLLLIIQFTDWNKRDVKEAQYLVEIETAYDELLNFQTLIINGDVAVDTNKEVLKMSEKNFQYQLSMFIDIFGNQTEDDESLYDYYKKTDTLLTQFYEANSVEEQKAAYAELEKIRKPFKQFLEKLVN